MMTGNNKNGTKRTLWQRVVSFMMALAMVFSFVPTAAFGGLMTAQAADTKTIYLDPGGTSLWNQGDAWFEAWVWGSSQPNAWYTFENMDGVVFKIEVPADATGMKVLRRGPSHAAGSWDSKWNATGDLDISGGNNLVKITGWGTGTMVSDYTYTVPNYIVAGGVSGNDSDAGIFGTAWDSGNEANQMVLNAETGLYEVKYTGVAAETYTFKVTDGSWTNAWPASNFSLTVAESGSTVVIRFNPGTQDITFDVKPPVSVTLDLGDNLWSSNTAATVVEREEYTTTITANPGYNVPQNIEVTVGTAELTAGSSYTYDWTEERGVLTIPAESVTGDITVKAASVAETYDVTVTGDNVIADEETVGEDKATYGVFYGTALKAAEGYTLPENITVKVGGVTLTAGVDYQYTASNGTLSIVTAKVTGDIEIIVDVVAVPAPDYYLIGWINGANYGFEEDYANLGDYKFEDGKVTATFTSDSYVFVKTGDNANWYMAEAYSEATAVVLKNTTTGSSEKLFVPAGEVEFTLLENGDGTLTLSYEVKSEPVVEYYVAGNSAALFGAEWAAANDAGKMTLNAETGLYEITFTNVAASDDDYEFKVTDGTWDNSWGDSETNGNIAFSVEKDGSAVTITFDADTKEIAVTVTAPPPAAFDVTFAGTNVTSNGAETATEGVAYTATLTAAEGYTLPENITVKVGDDVLSEGYSYNAETGALTVNVAAVTGNITITAEGVEEVVEPETITVYFTNNKDWSSVKAYAWDENDAALLGAWSGSLMTYVETNDYGQDIFSIEVPDTVAGIVFNGTAGGTTEQTVDVTEGIANNVGFYCLDEKDGVKYKVGSYTYQPSTPDTADYYLVGYINNADYNGNDYKFVDGKVTVTFANDSYVVVKDASGDWYLCESYCTDTTATLIKGKSEKMFVAAGTEWEFTLVENGDGTLTLSYAEVTGDDGDDGDDTAKTTYTVTFHVANTMGWSPLNLYVWNNDGASTGGWPGTDMNTKDVDGYNTLSVSYDSASNQGLNYIFNNGSTQTVDLKVDAADFGDKTAIDLWFKLDPTRTNSEGKVLAEGVTVSTEPFADLVLAVSPQVVDADGDGKVNDVIFEYAGDSATTSVELRGTVTGASWGTGPALTDTDGDKLWTLTVKNLAPAVYEYKFVVNGESWTTDPANGKTNAEGNSVFTIRDPNAVDDNTITVNVYYDRADGIYTVENADGVGVTGVWNAYAWGDSIPGTRMDFAADANGKMVSTIELKGRETTYIAFKTRLSTAAKDWLQEESEVRVNLTKVLAGTVNVYITSNGTGGNKGTLTPSVVEDADVFEGNKVLSASYNYDNNTIEVTMLEALADADANELTLKAPAGGVGVASIAASGVTYTLSLSAQPDLSALSQYKIVYDGYEYDIDADAMYASDKFAEEFTYDGDDLGANYTAAGTTFKVWAPTATAVDVLLYADGNAVDKFGNFEGTASAPFADYRMTKGENGVWSVTIDGELKGVYYTYQVWFGDEKVEAVDPYARATGVNGMRGMVIDLDATDPEGWDTDTNPNPVTSQTDAIIYELHVRDFSIDDSSGVSEANRGKYLAFTEEGTTTESGSVTGIDYLDELGITHLHLLPVYDYASVDETKCDTFNWGYDPQNYNVPEGSYSTDPANGAVRVKEFKQMVKSLHDHDISVIMDVVYNHVYDAETFCYNNIVPGYFSRVNSNTSGCGNDTASEREMVRKYIVESVLYWAEEYHIDGFRFDLVGLLDVQTINQIVTEVHAIRPDIVFYGEGWDMDSTNKEPGTEMAKQGNASKTPGFAYFSDSMRNGIAGSNGQSTGFASGAGNGGAMESEWKANPWWTTNPQQVIQYASCHDNYTLIDKLVLSTGASGLNSSIIKMNNLTAAFYMTSQGVTFIHAGEEFLREKLEEDGGRCENSYNASDFVNHIEWSNLDSTAFDYAGNVEYYKGLIEFRKAHPALRYATAAEVAANVTTLANDGKLMVMRVDGNGYNTANPDAAVAENDILVIFNSNSASQSVTLPDGEWTVNINATKAGTASLGTAEGTVTVDGISAMVLTTVDMGKDEEPPAAASKEKTIYFSNNKHWDKIYAYYWTDDDSVDDPEWPGIQLMQPVGTNDYGEDIYAVTLPAADPGIAGLIFSDGGSEQTVDIVPGIDGTGYYPTDSKNDEGKWPVGSWQYRAPQLGAADEYFLVGYINNVDYAGDEYKFDENGQLTTTFPTDSYVYVVNGTGALTYMTDGYLGTVTEAMLENIATETLNSDKWDKMLIPGGAEVTITLEKNDGDDRCVWLSYEIAYSDLTDASGVQEGVTLHAWNWSFAEIEANMAQIAAQGYTAVQTSPIQAMKETTVGSTVGGHWWVYYQPVDFVINTDEGNALGTKAELESMIETAHEYGVKVIVDVVANHLGNKTGNDLADAIPDYLRKDEYWHSIDINISNWNDRYNMTQYCLDGLPDLNTANDELQGYVLDFLKECVDAGVDGFRFDMAKSIETPKDDDSFASDFWPTVVGGAEAYALANYDKDLYIYGEVLDNAGISINAYTEYMAVTDNGWGNHMRSNVADGKAELVAGFYKAAPADQLVIWAESHDTYATSDAGQSSAGVSEADINKTWALVAAREGAMGLYLARPANNDQLLGVGAVTGWANPEVAEVNKFHTLFAGTSETIGNEVMDNGVAVSYVVRSNHGAVLVKVAGSGASRSGETAVSFAAPAMADGSYADQITGNTFTVTNGVISGSIGTTGIAVLYDPADTIFDITAEDTTGGSFVVQDATTGTAITEAQVDDLVRIVATPETGKVVERVTVTTVNGLVDVIDEGDNAYSFIMPWDDVTVAVTFADTEYAITLLPDDGTVNCNQTENSAPYGAEVCVWANPGEGMMVETVTVADANGNAVETTYLYELDGEYNYSFVMPASDVIVTFTYAEDAAPNYPVTVAPATGGSVYVNYALVGSAEEGDIVQIEATPDEGMAVDAITVTDADGNPVEVEFMYEVDGVCTYQFSMPASAVNIAVTFKEAAAEAELYDITVNAGEGGTVLLPADGLPAGTLVTFEVLPEDGMEIDTVTVTGVDGRDVPVTKVEATTFARARAAAGVLYSYVQPDCDVIIEVTFKAAEAPTPTPTPVPGGSEPAPTPTPVPGGSEPAPAPTPAPGGSAPTGDSAPVVLWLGAMAAAGMAAFGLLCFKRKKSEEEA